MLTQCPSCHARTRLPDAHAGARVRCSECGRVFVARADAAGTVPRRASRVLFLGGLAGVLTLIALIVFLRASGEAGPTDGPARAPEPDGR
jgi:predicted Zn finger-like uncharacterized protein